EMLAGDTADLAVAGIAVGIVRWLAEDAHRARFLVPFQHAIVRDVAPDQAAHISEPHRALAPAGAQIEAIDARQREMIFAKARIESGDERIGIAQALRPAAECRVLVVCHRYLGFARQDGWCR